MQGTGVLQGVVAETPMGMLDGAYVKVTVIQSL